MISSIASISSSSPATVRVEKATSEFLMTPDWTMNIDICDTINSNQMLAKDVVKAVKKRLQHKNPKVQLLALTLLETMVKNCGDYVHLQIAEKNILQDMIKIVRKRADMQVRGKILMLIESWHDAFGGSQGRYPQYFMAYEDLRRSGVQFPQRLPDAAPIFTPPVTNPVSKQPQPGYGMPSSSSTRLDEAMAADVNFSLSSINSMREVLDLFTDMLQAIDPTDHSAVKDEVIVDLVEQCRANQKKLMDVLASTGDEEFLGQGLDLNDCLQIALAKHDAIASGSPLPPEAIDIKPHASVEQCVSPKPVETHVSNANLSAPVVAAPRHVDEEEDEEDDFALLARRHSKPRIDVSYNTNTEPSEIPSSPVMSNALVPISIPAEPVRSKDQDIIDLLSITLSTTPPTEQAPVTSMHSNQQSGPIPSATFSSEAYLGNSGSGFNSYVAPWAQPKPQPTFQSQTVYGSHFTPQRQHQPQPQPQFQPQQQSQLPEYPSGYIPPPWAVTPGYLTNPNPVSRPPQIYSHSSTLSSGPRPPQREQSYGETQVQKPFVPSYRLFEDLDVFGNTDGRFKANNSNASSQSMVGGRK